MKGLNGNTKEQHDLIVNIDLVYMTVTIKTLELPVQDIWCLSKDLVADLKEVFMLFDKDEDGVLTFSELDVVMKCLGQRTSGNFHQYDLFSLVISEKELLRMVRDVSEDKMYDTIEFNEFLTMIGKQSKNPISKESLIEAFK